MRSKNVLKKLLLTGTLVFSCVNLITHADDLISIKPILYSITTEEGHTITFHEIRSGGFFITENATLSQKPLLNEALVGEKSLADIYRIIQPKGNIPNALKEADARISALKLKLITPPALIPNIPSPPKLSEGTEKGPKLYNAGQQTWFKSTFCHDTYGSASLVNCVQGWSWAHSGWVKGPHFSWDSMVGSEGVPASLKVYNWNGSSEYLDYTTTVSPGTYSWGYYSDNSPTWHHADLDGAGNNTQVSQAIQNCGNGGQWACSTNCGGSIACDPKTSTYCSIVGAHGESWCNAH
jgi:hypothetical protein